MVVVGGVKLPGGHRLLVEAARAVAGSHQRPTQHAREADFGCGGLELDELLTRDPTIKSTSPAAPPTVFLAGGQSYFRDSWFNRGAGQRYLLFHGVAVADNHNHDDHLSFLIEAEGQMMCSDSGYSRGTYTGAERGNWYVTAAAHNTLTFDGKPAGDAAPNQTPPSLFQFARPGLVGEEKVAYFGKTATWHRAIFWIAGDYYVVSDRLNATRPGQIAAYFHGGRGTLADDGPRHTWTYSADRYGPAAVLHAWQAAPGAKVATKQGELTYIKGDYGEFPYLELGASAPICAWLTLLKPAAVASQTTFAVEDRSTGSASALAVQALDHRCLVVAQSQPGLRMKVDDVETDGAFALVRRDPSSHVISFAVLDGTFLTVAGQEVWRSVKSTSIAESR